MSDSNSAAGPRLPLFIVGMSLSLTLVVTYTLCIVYGLLGFSEGMHATILPQALPGFTWLTWPSFFLGAIEVFAYGWYFALTFGLIFNFCSALCARRLP